jgi:hypothetical protein
MNRNRPRGKVITLLRKSEMSDLLGRDITSSEWYLVQKMVVRDKELWACLDSILATAVNQLGKEKQ